MPVLEGFFVRKLAFLVAVLLAPAAFPAAPAEGVPLQVRRGFFTETDIGGFFTVGGNDGYSNLQTYLQLGLGYQLTLNNGAGLVPVGLHVAMGANAQNCFSGRNAAGDCVETDNFTITFISASGGYLARVMERLYVGGKVLLGWTLLDPAPVYKGSGTSRSPVNQGLNAGAALSVEYATNMDHFSIGLDVAYRIVVGPMVSSLGFYPRVQYTF